MLNTVVCIRVLNHWARFTNQGPPKGLAVKDAQSKRRFDVIITCLLRCVFAGNAVGFCGILILLETLLGFQRGLGSNPSGSNPGHASEDNLSPFHPKHLLVPVHDLDQTADMYKYYMYKYKYMT